MANQTIRFYFSFRSPFAAVALYRLRRLPQFTDFEIEVIPVWPEVVFGGHMDNPTDNLFKLIYVFHDAARQAEEAGLHAGYLNAIAANFKIPTGMDFTQQKVGIPMEETNWAQSHVGFLYAQDQGKGWEFADAVFNARFGLDGKPSRNVLEPDTLKDIASSMGLDTDQLLSAHEAPEYLERHQSMIRQSERDGVFGVPFFVVPDGDVKQVFWGNDKMGYLLKFLTSSVDTPQFARDDLTTVQYS